MVAVYGTSDINQMRMFEMTDVNYGAVSQHNGHVALPGGRSDYASDWQIDSILCV